MNKDEFLKQAREIVERKSLASKLHEKYQISENTYIELLDELRANSAELLSSYYSKDNEDCEAVTRDDVDYVFGVTDND